MKIRRAIEENAPRLAVNRDTRDFIGIIRSHQSCESSSLITAEYTRYQQCRKQTSSACIYIIDEKNRYIVPKAISVSCAIVLSAIPRVSTFFPENTLTTSGPRRAEQNCCEQVSQIVGN